MMIDSPVDAAMRLGIDLGGSKIAGVALGPSGATVAEHRMAAPRGDYAATLRAIGDMIAKLEQEAGAGGTVGIGMPGSISPASGLVQNANSTWLNGKAFGRDLEIHLRRPVRLANDANCFALSEAADGAGAGSSDACISVAAGASARSWRTSGPATATSSPAATAHVHPSHA